MKPRDESQEQYWALSYRQAQAHHELKAADEALADFARKHEGESFKVFRPEDIEAAIDDSIEPLHFDIPDALRW